MITTWLRIPVKCLYHLCTMHLSWDVDCPNKIFSQFIYHHSATELNSNSMAYESSPSTITELFFDNAPAFDKHLCELNTMESLSSFCGIFLWYLGY